MSIMYSEADKTLSADLNRRLMQQRRDFCNFQLEVAEEAKRRHEQAEQELTATITLVKPRRTRRSKYHV